MSPIPGALPQPYLPRQEQKTLLRFVNRRQRCVRVAGVLVGVVATFLLTWIAFWTSTAVVATGRNGTASQSQQLAEALSPTGATATFSSNALSQSQQLAEALSPTGATAVFSSNAILAKCFPFNTARWLQAERIQNNAQGTDLTASFRILMPPPMLNGSQAANDIDGAPPFLNAMEQTICMRGARFFSLGADTTHNISDGAFMEQAIKVWTVRVVYLATQFHQHYLAWPEYNHRLQYTHNSTEDEDCKTAWADYHMTSVDFECTKAKFLVIPLGDNGLGANLRLAAMPVLKTALASGRVALYINSFNQSQHGWIRKHWTLASCPRRDYQCFFLPPSPCVLSHEEYRNAHVLDKYEMRTLFRQGTLPHLEDERVLVYSPTFRPQREPPKMRDRLAHIGRFLVAQGVLPDSQVVRKAIQRIVTPVDEGRTAFEGDDELAGGLLLYVSRPRPHFLRQLYAMEPAPQSHTVGSLGLPIRASDKCIAESQCFSFETYLQAAEAYWLHKWPNTPNGTPLAVFVTTESTDVLQQKRSWTQRKTQAPWMHLSFELLHNSHDVAQDTGLIREIRSDRLTADQVMLSSLSSLRAQLTHRIVLGNCCSNFHRLIQILVRSGCSSDWEAEFVCLQHHPIESFRLCCAWDKSSRCLEQLGKKTTGNTTRRSVIDNR